METKQFFLRIEIRFSLLCFGQVCFFRKTEIVHKYLKGYIYYIKFDKQT